MEPYHFIAGCVGGYFLGSIPTGYIAAKIKGIDIRTVGSGNIGATNVFRILGKAAGITVLVIDALKGFLAATAFPWLIWTFAKGEATTGWMTRDNLETLCGVSAVLGHNYTCWLKFKGGKGIATSAGVLLGLMPLVVMVLIAVWGVFFMVFRYVSVASIAAAVALPIATWFMKPNRSLFVIGCFLGALAIYKHRGNIQRLRAGTENRVGRKKEKTL